MQKNTPKKKTEENVTKNKPSRKKRLLIVLLCIFIFIVNVLAVLQAGVMYTAASWEFWYPDYEKVNIEPLLKKANRTEEEYQTLYAQTGLTKTAIDDMLSETNLLEENIQRILEIQAVYFTPAELRSRCFNPFTYLDEIDIHTKLLRLRDGDIIVSATTRVSWFRYGHAALVIDGDEETIIESIGPGTDSKTNSALTFCDLANFLVLRPKVDKQTKSEVVAYARENLKGIPYRLTTGILYDKAPENIQVSQCAHLVWYAYNRFGIDLDYNGGAIVKPQDMALSDKVEVVQVYGFDPVKLWGE